MLGSYSTRNKDLAGMSVSYFITCHTGFIIGTTLVHLKTIKRLSTLKLMPNLYTTDTEKTAVHG